MGNIESKNALKILYGCRCLLTNIEDKNLQYHHIEKREWGGDSSVENGALLINDIHAWLHNEIEQKDPALFYLINECLLLYKMCIDQGKEELVREYEQNCIPEFVKRLRRRK